MGLIIFISMLHCLYNLEIDEHSYALQGFPITTVDLVRLFSQIWYLH